MGEGQLPSGKSFDGLQGISGIEGIQPIRRITGSYYSIMVILPLSEN
jgi:hypothetical protein